MKKFIALLIGATVISSSIAFAAEDATVSPNDPAAQQQTTDTQKVQKVGNKKHHAKNAKNHHHKIAKASQASPISVPTAETNAEPETQSPAK